MTKHLKIRVTREQVNEFFHQGVCMRVVESLDNLEKNDFFNWVRLEDGRFAIFRFEKDQQLIIDPSQVVGEISVEKMADELNTQYGLKPIRRGPVLR